MSLSNHLTRQLWPVATLLMLGCAPAYHSYTDCHVDCHYCVPPPLSYTHYAECVCHSCAVAPYLRKNVEQPIEAESMASSRATNSSGLPMTQRN